ncbi:MAG: hypothetical protein AAB692_00350, partial [Patescibacteria group bacterium]
WYAISAKGPWWLKLFLIVVIPLMGVYSMKELVSYQGYPTSEPVPEKGLLMQIDVREPNKESGDPGVINVWLRPLGAGKKGPGFLEYDPKREPRAYRMPYSREMHERLEQARQMMGRGKRVVVGMRGVRGSLFGRGSGQSGGTYGDSESEIEIYEMPPVHLPPKDPEDDAQEIDPQ